MRDTAARLLLHESLSFCGFILVYVFWDEEEAVLSLPGAVYHFTDHIQDDIYFNVMYMLLDTNARYNNLCVGAAVMVLILPRVEKEQEQ